MNELLSDKGVTASALAERYTIAELTEIYSKFDDERDAIKQHLDSLDENVEMVKGALAMKMDQEQLTNVKTAFGTPYFKTFQSIKVAERELFFDWVFEHRASDVLTSAVAKDGVRERADHGENVPGLQIEMIRKLLVLRK